MRRWPVVAVMLAVLAVWGVAFSVIKILLRDLSPSALTAGRLWIAALTYLLLLPAARGGWPTRERGDVWRLVVIGLTGSVAYHLAINWGEQYISAGVASIVVSSMPVMVALLAAVVLREPLGPGKAIGVGVAFGGVILLVVGSGQGLEARSTAGILVTLISPAAWAVYTVVAKPLASRYDGVRLNLVGGWVGAILVLPLGLAEWRAFTGLGPQGWGWLIFLGALSSAGAYVAYTWALRAWTASAVAAFVYLVPVSSLISAWVLLGEVPSARALGGGALIIGGVVMVQRAR